MVEMTPYDLTKGRITFGFWALWLSSRAVPEKVCVVVTILAKATNPTLI